MSYPSKLKLFKAWAKAMEQGATVGKPSYSQTMNKPTPRKRGRKFRRKRRSKGD